VVGREVATPRGLQVGDSLSRVGALYGMPSDSLGGPWQYDDPRERSPGTHVIQIELRAGRVQRIYVGWIAD
jgi:hypothetical protein